MCIVCKVLHLLQEKYNITKEPKCIIDFLFAKQDEESKSGEPPVVTDDAIQSCIFDVTIGGN